MDTVSAPVAAQENAATPTVSTAETIVYFRSPHMVQIENGDWLPAQAIFTSKGILIAVTVDKVAKTYRKWRLQTTLNESTASNWCNALPYRTSVNALWYLGLREINGQPRVIPNLPPMTVQDAKTLHYHPVPLHSHVKRVED